MKYKNGSLYKGEFLRGKKDGTGTLTKTSVDYSYTGEWVNNLIAGLGELAQDGLTYRGEFEGGKKVRNILNDY